MSDPDPDIEHEPDYLPILRYIQHDVVNRKLICKIHIKPLTVSAHPDYILKPVFHKTKDTGLNIYGLEAIFYL